MQHAQWQLLAHQEVIVCAGYKEHLRLGKLLGCGGAGAVYDMCQWGDVEWVIKVLDPESPVAKQEFKSLNFFRGKCRYEIGLMKFNAWAGLLRYDNQVYPCYMMRKGRTLAQAIQDGDDWLNNPQEIMRQTAYLINGICSLKKIGLSHGDIKPENILLVEYKDTSYAMFSDYGTVSDKKHGISSDKYNCEATEYASPLEERIAYDLHCLYKVLCLICGVEDDVIFGIDQKLSDLLCIMRKAEEKAFVRLKKVMDLLKEYDIAVPVSFYLDAIPMYELTEDFPFEEVKQWGKYAILRDKNAIPGTAFDPLLLLQIEPGRYEKVYNILVEHNNLNAFVMPIARYRDKNGNEYVLIHAPDDKNKCISKNSRGIGSERIQDESGVPYTLSLAMPGVRARERNRLNNKLNRRKVKVEISPEDIWHLDESWKLNLFSVKILDFVEQDTEKRRIL